METIESSDFALPPGAWNSHVHSFDPEKHPFKENRAYTPLPAPLSELLKHAKSDNILLVQATIEDGPENLVENLKENRKLGSGRLLRGTIFADPVPSRSLNLLSSSDFDRLHEAGVRSIRIHGSYGGSGDQLDWVRDQFLQAARLRGVKNHKWSLSAQLPLKTWSQMSETILSHPELQHINIIADHNGSAVPADADSPDVQNFVRMLMSGHVFVKIGALHRRSPNDVALMKPIIRCYLDAAPHAVVWGSDWPHCDTQKKGPVPSGPLEGVDTTHELQTLRSWMSEDEWMNVMVNTPTRLFGC